MAWSLFGKPREPVFRKAISTGRILTLAGLSLAHPLSSPQRTQGPHIPLLRVRQRNASTQGLSVN